ATARLAKFGSTSVTSSSTPDRTGRGFGSASSLFQTGAPTMGTPTGTRSDMARQHVQVHSLEVAGNPLATGLTAIATPAALTDSPATADALRDDIVAKLVPAIDAILARLRSAGIIVT